MNGNLRLKHLGASANNALAAVIGAAAIIAVEPSGSLGALVKNLFDGTTTAMIGVVDTGKGDVSLFNHSSNNVTRITTVLAALSGVQKFTVTPTVTNGVTTTGWTVGNQDGTSIQGEVVFPNSGTIVDNAIVPDPDTRTAFETAMAAIGEPAAPAMSLAQLIENIDKTCSLPAFGKEALILVNEPAQTVTVYVVADTSAITNFQDGGTITSIDANSLIGVWHVEPVAGAAARSVI